MIGCDAGSLYIDAVRDRDSAIVQDDSAADASAADALAAWMDANDAAIAAEAAAPGEAPDGADVRWPPQDMDTYGMEME